MIRKLLKTLTLILVITLCGIDNAMSQDSQSTIRIKDIPPQGIILDSGWRFHVGDSPRYSGPSFDDSSWQLIDPTLDIHTSLPQVPEGEICWIRIRLSIDSSVNHLVMQIQQSIASEIFVNGKLIHRIGELGLNADRIRAANPRDRLYSFPFNSQGITTLSVRFAKQPGIGYATHWKSSNPGFSVKLNGVEMASAYFKGAHISVIEYDYSRAGIFGILAVLYLAFYIFYPPQRANLYFSIYAFLQSITWGTFIFYHQFDWIEFYFVIANAILVVQLTSHIFMLEAIHETLKIRKGWVYYMLVVLAVACIPIGVFAYDWGWKIYGRNFTLIYYIGVTFIVFRSFRTNRVAATIVAIGGVCFILVWIAFTNEWFPSYSLHLFSLGHLSMPLAVSVYLGYDFALKNRSLQQKLVEVETLSEEKNRILSTQNEILEKQVDERTAELTKSLDHLKSTQAQLIQSEKMASLGELTAGIAHEIQNPLNFVNNFSEVNTELIDDLKNELTSGRPDAAEELANIIKTNEEKISHHGKRADAIVKSMLQHSRTSSGQKESTDINLLCDEYLRLAYHGYRAKDKSFNAKFEADFDRNLPKLNVVPNDIGRVILNLANNAFYAVSERAKRSDKDFQSLVNVSTKAIGNSVQIRVSDNGSGIPEHIKEKIFHPFFTTKPAGQGTGLGLSLAFDIVKAHGGDLSLVSSDHNGTTFQVNLIAR